MSDEELRNLERRALSGDLNAALRYTLALERNGGMGGPIYPSYNYASKYGNLLISPLGAEYDFRTTLVFNSGVDPNFPEGFKAQLEFRHAYGGNGLDFKTPEQWYTDRFTFLADYSLDRSQELSPPVIAWPVQAKTRDDLRDEIREQLAVEVNAWAASHLAEMHHAEDLSRQEKVINRLQRLHRAYEKAKDEEDELSKLTITWLSKKINYSSSS